MSGGIYRVAFTPAARRAVARLPEKAASAAVEFCLGPLAAAPGRLGKPLQRELAGYHSAHRGGYRVIYRIDDVNRKVYVVRIEHRSDVYRSR